MEKLFVEDTQHVEAVEDIADKVLDDSMDEVYIEDMVEKGMWNKVVLFALVD